MRRAPVVLLLLFAFVLSAAAADHDFNAVVKGVEKQYGIRRSHPHLLGLFMFVAKPAMWGSGAKGLKLAVFEDVRAQGSIADLDRIMAGSLGTQWQPFIRANSPARNESSVIYVSFAGKQMRMMIASIERDEIAVVHIKVSQKAVRQWVDEPQREATHRAHNSGDR